MKKLSKQLDEYMGILVILFFVVFIGIFVMTIHKTGSGIQWQLAEMRGNIQSFKKHNEKVVAKLERKYDGHAHERAEKNKAMFFNLTSE